MGTPARYYSSTAVTTTLASSIGSSDTSLQVASNSGFPSSYPFTLILEKDSANEEIVTVTALVGSAYAVTRGVDGTSARAHSAGTSVEHGVSALDFTDMRAHQAAAANVHDIGASASVVGTTTAQTLTNKTLTSPTINGGSINADSAQVAGDDVVTEAATQTLTNKTLTSPTIAGGTLTGDVAAGSNRITGLADPASAQDAATRNFVETGVTSQVVAATTQASNAAASATAAAASESAAASSESASAASESAAATSASNAGTSATNAAASATAAAASESAAATSETAAGVSATNAASSATAAAASATAAAASESAAATSESNAAASATASASSATSSAASATSAANSAAAAATALDNFDDRYLGQKASAPSTDNDGDPLVTGALYYDTTQGKMFVYDGAGWLPASAASIASIVSFEFTATSGQTVFTGADDNGVSLAFTQGLVQVFLNGVLLSPGDDYTTSTNTVTLASGAALNDVLVVVAFASFAVADTYTQAQADAAFVSTDGGSTVEASGAAVTPLVLKGASGQTANLLTVENSAGTDLVVVNASGNVGMAGFTAPDVALDIRSEPGPSVRLGRTTTNVVQDSLLGAVEFWNSDSSSSNVNKAAEVRAEAADAVGRFANLTMRTSDVERMRINNAGAVLIGTTSPGSAAAGDLVVNGGVFLGGTAAANELDDYEEGTWTPTYVPETGAFGSITYRSGTTSGYYRKVGSVVFISGAIATDALTIGTASGVLRVAGLPFTNINVAGNGDFASITVSFANNWAGEHPISSAVFPGQSYLQFFYRTAIDGRNFNTEVIDLDLFTNDNEIMFGGFYFTA